ncbi:MAG: YqgE/AlgH family protein [Candidatus Accumulibacter sp.]|jgi:putative transcriptional regulator|nr:YqgE/AlgH family protein [Accumulibacter sp.]
MPASIQLTDHFLIAMPAMEDPYFAKSLVYVAEHNDQGALGVIVNRPIDMTLSTLFQRIELPCAPGRMDKLPVFFGGPVQTDRGFVLHRPLGKWQSTLAVNSEIGLTTSRDVLQSAGQAGDPRDMVVTLGYSGWAGGQLEHEIGQNAWLTVPADPRILFEMPYEERLASALELLGIDLTNLAGQAGHA